MRTPKPNAGSPRRRCNGSDTRKASSECWARTRRIDFWKRAVIAPWRGPRARSRSGLGRKRPGKLAQVVPQNRARLAARTERLWGYQKGFRKLFAETWTQFKIHKRQNIKRISKISWNLDKVQQYVNTFQTLLCISLVIFTLLIAICYKLRVKHFKSTRFVSKNAWDYLQTPHCRYL